MGTIVQSVPYPSYTTLEREDLIVPIGYKIYNTDLGLIETYEGIIDGWVTYSTDYHRVGQALHFGLEAFENNNATKYVNLGAGYQYSFSSSANQEILGQIAIDTNHLPNGIKIIVGAELYSLTPSANDVVELEIDYAFLDIGDNGYTKVDGTITKLLDVSSFSPDTIYEIDLGDIPTVPNKRGLSLTFRRNGSSVNDTYGSSFDIYGFNLIKL